MLSNKVMRTTLIAHYGRPQRRLIFNYAVSHPAETTALALGAATAVAGYRIWKLELRIREQEQALRARDESMRTQEQYFRERERELRGANESFENKYMNMRDETKRMEASIIERNKAYEESIKNQEQNFTKRYSELRSTHEILVQKYNKILDETKRMEASITERGKAGEEILGQLLEDCKSHNIIKDYELQHQLPTGKRPDAVVDFGDNIRLAIDSKSPKPPNSITDGQARQEYTEKLKGHVRQLSDKQYNATTEQNIPMITLMMLPGEGYLQAAYDQGNDIYGIHKFAIDRKVLILGPNGLRTSLQIVKIWLEYLATNDRLEDIQVRENIVTTLLPLWNESLLPFTRTVSNRLQNIVTTWNSNVDSIVAFDQALRSKDILDIAKAKKTKLPKKVTSPKSFESDDDK